VRRVQRRRRHARVQRRPWRQRELINCYCRVRKVIVTIDVDVELHNKPTKVPGTFDGQEDLWIWCWQIGEIGARKTYLSLKEPKNE
jgi:hypothetical protein